MVSVTDTVKPVVQVVWKDAHVDATETMSLTYIQQTHHKAQIMQTLGWLVFSDDEGVTVANERCLDQGEEVYRGCTFIPRSLIQSITPVVKPRAPRKPKPPPSTPSTTG